MNFITYITEFGTMKVKTIEFKNQKYVTVSAINEPYLVTSVFIDNQKVNIVYDVNPYQVAVINDNNFDGANLDVNSFNQAGFFQFTVQPVAPVVVNPLQPQNGANLEWYSVLPFYGLVRPEIILTYSQGWITPYSIYGGANFKEDTSVKELEIDYGLESVIATTKFVHNYDGIEGNTFSNSIVTKPQTWGTNDVINHIDDIFFTCQYRSVNARLEAVTFVIRVYPRYNFVFVYPQNANYILGQTNYNNRYAQPSTAIDFEYVHKDDPTKFYRFYMDWKKIPDLVPPNYAE